MFFRLALLFIAVPLIELALLVTLGQRVGLVPTVALVVLTGILGAALARHQGLATLGRLQAALAAGKPPHRELAQSALILLAGAVLLTPGLLTDIAGFLLLAPAIRRRAAQALVRALGRRFTRVRVSDPGAVEVDYEVVDPAPRGEPREPPRRLPEP
ncbi:MAG: FxsA family protein [Acidobacteriota bacterium]